MIPLTIMIQGSSNKERYCNFCNSGKDVPLFLQPWWMNAVCKAKDWWKVFLYEENDEIKGVFICNIVKINGVENDHPASTDSIQRDMAGLWKRIE